MQRRLFLPLLAVLCMGLAVWQTRLLLAQLGSRGGPPDVDTALAEQGPFVVGITREGTLESTEVASVRAPMMESNLTWVVEDGKRVKRGEVVAKLDTSQYRFEVDSSRLQYQNRAAQVDQERRSKTRDYETAKMDVEKTIRSLDVLSRSLLTEGEQGQAQVGYDLWNLRFAETDYDKQSRLSRVGIVPMTQVEHAERNVRSKQYALVKSEKDVGYLGAQHQVKKAQASAGIDTARFNQDLTKRRIREAVQSAMEQARMSKRQLEEMEENLAQGILTAPKDGIVVLGNTWDMGGRRTLREGDRAWYQMKICDITDLTALQVTARVDEAAASRLKINQEATITVTGVPRREFKGRITAVAAMARKLMFWEAPNADPNLRVFDVTVEMLDTDMAILRPGMKAKVRFVFERIADAIYLPVSAVFDRPPRGEFVYVLHSRRFEERKVITGKRNDESVAITRGLKRGECIALSDPTRVASE